MSDESQARNPHELEAELREKGFEDERVLAALRAVPRQRFLPAEFAVRAWRDEALPLPHGQSISQPYVVATMCAALALGERTAPTKVLEVGTGWGYQAAVLSKLANTVITIERVPELAHEARRKLAELGVENVRVVVGDGSRGHPTEAPYDGIVVAAAAERVPDALVGQLAPGARLVLPLGGRDQRLVVLERTPSGLARRELYPVRFVPLVHERDPAGEAGSAVRSARPSNRSFDADAERTTGPRDGSGPAD
ncbi:MAG: protein-L-isoaspartate(D-aspartate) O-methyltransferase [Planctomycetes bacterium]|nr:protein-L-isoaspartate(D-aspartate) O-methyltransferase [Planctomycetota bacterium]